MERQRILVREVASLPHPLLALGELRLDPDFPCKTATSWSGAEGIRSLTSAVQSQFLMSWLFAALQNLLQIGKFFLASYCDHSPFYVWVGVLLVYRPPSHDPVLARTLLWPGCPSTLITLTHKRLAALVGVGPAQPRLGHSARPIPPPSQEVYRTYADLPSVTRFRITTPATISTIPVIPAQLSDSRQNSTPTRTAPAVPRPDQIA
jgi:hypothetical protein